MYFNLYQNKMLSFRRNDWLKKLCVSLGIPREVGSLRIEGLAVLPLLCKKRHKHNKKLQWFLNSHWWIFTRFATQDRCLIIKQMNADWKQQQIALRGAIPKSPMQKARAKSMTQAMDPKYNKKYWISIGINNYENMQKLHCAENDATRLANFAKNKLKFDATASYLNLNREAIVNLIKKQIFENLQPNDLLVITFHGHCVSKTIRNCIFGFLAPIEGDQENLASLIGLKDIANWLQYIKSRHVLLILDCCFSGISALRGSPKWSSNYSASTIKVHLAQNCRIVINAGTSNQQTLDGGWENNSVLTGAIISYPFYEHTAGAVSELFGYISKTVSQNCGQTPTMGKLVGDHGGDMFLGL